MKRNLSALVLTLVLLIQLTTSYADTGTAVNDLSTQWAKITYATPANEHKALLKALYTSAQDQVARDSGNADLLTWAGIVTASYAGARGDLSSLKLVKKARKYFERAMDINTDALNGGARISLGAMYYKVPSWPIGFGKDKYARKLLSESYRKHPDNIDALYFYADFLKKKKQINEAGRVFRQALSLPARSEGEIRRHKQIEQQLAALS